METCTKKTNSYQNDDHEDNQQDSSKHEQWIFPNNVHPSRDESYDYGIIPETKKKTFP